MLRRIGLGIAAGAVGTAALNIATYADMALRGRPASSVPAKLAGRMADVLGVNLSCAGDDAKQIKQNRQEGLGALLGYVTGLGIGAAYGAARAGLRDLPLPLAGVGAGVAAMAASDVPAVLFGATDLSEWSASDWAWDLAFHLAYGVATALTFDALTEG